MPPQTRNPSSPAWDALYRIAEGQSGQFTTDQAREAGYLPQHLQKHLKAGRIHRLRRGIYRLTQFPLGDLEELVTLWLWSDQQGVFSHTTSLSLHALSDTLPAQVHMTLPEPWAARRLRLPEGLQLHYRDLPRKARTWHDLIPVTTPEQALCECIAADDPPEWIEQAIPQARQRGLITGPVAKKLTRKLREG